MVVNYAISLAKNGKYTAIKNMIDWITILAFVFMLVVGTLLRLYFRSNELDTNTIKMFTGGIIWVFLICGYFFYSVGFSIIGKIYNKESYYSTTVDENETESDKETS